MVPLLRNISFVLGLALFVGVGCDAPASTQYFPVVSPTCHPPSTLFIPELAPPVFETVSRPEIPDF